MLPLIFIIAVTGISIFINISIASEVTWAEYYRGGIIGVLVSAFILFLINQRRRKKEMNETTRATKHYI